MPFLARLFLALTMLVAVDVSIGSKAEARKWSALAYNTKTQRTGRAWNYPSSGAATRAAKRACGRGCGSITFKRCGAIAMNGRRGAFGWARRSTGHAARSAALRACRRKNRGCRIRTWQCQGR